MKACPVQGCGRRFDSPTLKQHVRRRHPNYESEKYTQNRGDVEQTVQKEIDKLPKIQTLKLQSRDKRPVDVYRKSMSKGKNDFSSALNTSKITSVIADSRSYIESTENSFKNTKRPSLSKRSSQGDNKATGLPDIKPNRHKKIEILGKLVKEPSNEEKDVLYTTAPNFKKLEKKDSLLRERSGSREKIASRGTIEQNILDKKAEADKLLMTRTMQSFHEKEPRLHRPLKRALGGTAQKSMGSEQSRDIQKKENKQLVESKEKIQIKPSEKHELKRNLQNKAKTIRRDNSLRKGEAKQQLSQIYNFEERIIVFKSNIGPRLTIPATAKVQFLFANNCGLSTLNLNNLQSLRELSLQHNSIKDLSFLNFANNYNIEKLFLDHNQLTMLDSLPINLRVLSVTFNQIEGLDITTKELGRLKELQEIDFTFNPIRKQSNYKVHLLSNCLGLKKFDGIKVTKFDLELAGQYARMLDEQMGLIPSQKYANLVISKCSNSPSTVVSVQTDQQPDEIGLSQEELTAQISKVTKILKQTSDHLKIIKQQNEIIKKQIHQLEEKQSDIEIDPGVLYNKLKIECEALQLLNFLQYCSEEELEELIEKKQREMA